MVAGLGDLGVRVSTGLARHGAVRRLILAGRQRDVGQAQANQLRVIARLAGGPEDVAFEEVDLEGRAALAFLLQRERPDVLVLTASRFTWWRPLAADPERARYLAQLPYGAWLPLHVALVRQVMEAWRDAEVDTRVVSLPYPDAVGPALAPLSLAPYAGAGNVSEVAAKVQVLAAANLDVDARDVRVHLVMHHAVERIAFGAFSELGGSTEDRSEPPWLGQVDVRGGRLPDAWLDRAVHAPYALPPGVASQEMTAAAAQQVVEALLSEQPRSIHVPAPGGLPGGYPVLASRAGIEMDLPAGVSRDEAVAVNERAARWDGLAAIESDGTIAFTPAVADASQRMLGLRLDRVRPADVGAVAAELLRRMEKE